MVELTRAALAQAIEARLRSERARLIEQWGATAPINYFVLDDLLPQEWVQAIRAAFPREEQMFLKSSLRELKYVAAQMNKYNPLLEEAIYAFQAPAIVQLIEEITGLEALEPDEMLYAGGISLMAPGHFLNPHVDNSHDKFRERYRVLNLLFYCSPEWSRTDGCNLEVWPEGPEKTPTEILSRFNRLVVMVTHRGSWHSVTRNVSAKNRCCVSNYYFSHRPVGGTEYFHVTSFRGRPEQPVRDLVLRADIWLRTALRRIFPKGVTENRHFYDRKPGAPRQ
jgi:Rps23 Pro-64 3,4-dihydroxylase Tpa1-like proline 4-hydroxylase